MVVHLTVDDMPQAAPVVFGHIASGKVEVRKWTFTFDRPGEYPIACNEYCGVAHHMMVGKLIVKKELP